MVYDSPDALKKAFLECRKNWQLPFEKTDMGRDLFSPDYSKFEAVLDESNHIRLIPVDLSYAYLFRGQTKEYKPCLPTIYREIRGRTPDAVDIFIERMRINVFKHLIMSHPVVNGFFIPHHFYIDILGLAQHYGLKTNVLDLTTDIDVAMFFAMCPYNSEIDSYLYYTDDDEHIGIIYLVQPFLTCPGSCEILFDKISPIGLQVFDRPGRQKGFAYHMAEGEDLFAVKYSFKYTSADSEAIYRKFNNGEVLWCKDVLVEKVKYIASMTCFQYNVFKETFDESPLKAYSKNRLKEELTRRSILVLCKAPMMEFSPEEKTQLVKEWGTSKSKELQSLITKRSVVIPRETKRGRAYKRPFMTFRDLANFYWLRIIMAADKSVPEGGEECVGKHVKSERITPKTGKIPESVVVADSTSFMSDAYLKLK